MSVYLWAKKVHRWTMFPTVALAVVQMYTGSAMKFGFEGANTRILHNQTAGYFMIFLGIQMITGLTMYIIPLLPKKPIA